MDVDFEKGGTCRSVIIVDSGLAEICTPIVCKAHGHAKHANTRGVWWHAHPGNFEKLHHLIFNLRVFFNNLSTFDVPVDTGSQTVLKCIICMPIHEIK